MNIYNNITNFLKMDNTSALLIVGALGRSRVICLLQDKVEKPGDIDGVAYTSIDKAGVWKYSLVKELKACGYDVDANRIM